jgi:DNA-binding transcriptional LysR family regulator
LAHDISCANIRAPGFALRTVTTRSIDPRLLQAFVAVAREGNVSRAAEKLFLSQPAVSLQLKELTEATKLELFTRTSNGVLLTRDGAALLSHAERALAGLVDFAQAAQRLKGGVRGRLRIGTILDPEFTRLGAFLHELVSLAPEIEPELQHGMSGTVLAKLQADEIDVGYYLGDAQADLAAQSARKRSKPSLTSEVLTRFTYRVIAPAGWGPQVQGRDWAALVKLPWILTPPESVHARLLAEVLEPLGLTQNRVALVDQESSMLALVRSGVGLSLARDSLAMRDSQSEGLVIADKVRIESTLCFVCKTAARDGTVVAAAWEALARVWRR